MGLFFISRCIMVTQTFAYIQNGYENSCKMLYMIKAVLFDMDGILYDSEYFYMQGTVAQMRAYGYDGPAKNIYRIIGTTMQTTYEMLYDMLDGKVPLDVIRENNERYFNVEHPIHFKEIMFPGVPQALQQIKKMGLKLAVCSASSYDLIVTSLKEMGILEYFDFIESGENCKRSKPYPDIYLLAQEALQVRKEECLVYEDSTAGIQAGISAGIRTVARIDNRFYQDQSKADILVKDIHELTELIRKENNYAGSN